MRRNKGSIMSKIEILAPVGSEEMLRAAVFSGADAVYLGFSGFNARTGAGNFDADSLKEAVRFCHARGVKVHVALNTTVYGGELAALADAVKAVAESGADAVICQDLAVAQLIGRIAPDLPRQNAVVGGDSSVPAISAASVLAKTYRDMLMEHLERRHPGYGFARHKGYGTADHYEALHRLGPCRQHRLTFRGVLPDRDEGPGTRQGSLL